VKAEHGHLDILVNNATALGPCSDASGCSSW
jgi:hypothetical protein